MKNLIDAHRYDFLKFIYYSQRFICIQENEMFEGYEREMKSFKYLYLKFELLFLIIQILNENIKNKSKIIFYLE